MQQTQSPKAGERTRTSELRDVLKEDLKRGDRVNIRNVTIGGKEVIEGAAIIRKRVKQDRFMVQFDGDDKDETYERFVMPEHRI